MGPNEHQQGQIKQRSQLGPAVHTESGFSHAVTPVHE